VLLVLLPLLLLLLELLPLELLLLELLEVRWRHLHRPGRLLRKWGSADRCTKRHCHVAT
jgi:hypothetical protein